MPLRRGNVDKFRPVRGVITEANKGAFPDDAAIDAENVEFLVDGTVLRRKGLDNLRGYYKEIQPGLITNRTKFNYFSYYRWRNVGVENLTYAVMQYGDLIYIRKEDDLDNFVEVVDLTDHESTSHTADDWTDPCEFAGTKNMLIIVHPEADPVVILVTESAGSNVLTEQGTSLTIRQEEILKDYTGITAGATLDDLEEFDLRNSGWAFYASCLNDQNGTSVTQQDPVANFQANHTSGEYPTPAVLYHRNKASNAVAQHGEGAFSTWEVYKSTNGLLQPPLGKAIINPWVWDTAAAMTTLSANTGGSKITATTTNFSTINRPQSVAIHAGHVFYGGKIWNKQPAILISQLIQDDFKGVGENSFERCYPKADPTDPEISGLVATDGLTLLPSGTGNIIKMVEFVRGLLIFTERQVIYLTGQGNQVAFTPVAFKIDVVSEEPAVSAKSVVIADDICFYFSRRGVQVIQRDERGGLTVNNITDQTIKSIFDGFSRNGLEYVQGIYVQEEKKVYWTVPDSGNKNDEQRQQANIILVYDFQIGGFYWHTTKGDDLEGTIPRLLYPMIVCQTTTEQVTEQVTTVGLVGITTVGGEEIITEQDLQLQAADVVGFAAIFREQPIDSNHDYFVDFVVFKNNSFHDWDNFFYTLAEWNVDPNGQTPKTDYTSFVEFGYLYPDTKAGYLNGNYIHSFFRSARPDRIEISDLQYPALPL